MNNYDEEYWKERFEHSQWQIPLSTRPISDDKLFSYIGYELINGLDPTAVNVETPPLGKYIFGLSIKIFDNAVYLSFASYILLFFTIFLFLRFYINERNYNLLLTLVIVLNPLIYSQSWLTLVDMPQLLFLITSLIFLNLIIKSNKNKSKYSFLSGSFIGMFFSIKFPLLFPIFFIYQSFIVLRYSKRFELYAFYLIGIGTFILLPYFRFFMLGNGIIDFLKIQKFIINFYAMSGLEVQKGVVWLSIFIGKLPEIGINKITDVAEWTIIWPIILILFLLYGFKIIKNKKRDIKLVALYISTLFILVIFTFIPFYARYLVVILPFLYLYSFLYFNNKKLRLLFLIFLLIISLISSYKFIIPKPEGAINDFAYNIQKNNFNDTFELQLVNKPVNNRNEFQYKTKKFLYDASVEQIEPIYLSSEKLSNNEIAVNFKFLYRTRFLGTFTENKQIKFVKENFKWKPEWEWDILLNELEPQYQIIATRDVGLRGSIINENGEILVEDTKGYLISVNPTIYDSKKEQELINILGNIIFVTPVNIQNAYLDDPSLGYVDVGTNYIDLENETIEKLLSFKGIRLESYPVRIYYELDPKSIENYVYPNCCTNIYSSSSYKGTSGLEAKYEHVLKAQDGGSILILDESNNIISEVVKRQKIDGKDVYLNKD